MIDVYTCNQGKDGKNQSVEEITASFTKDSIFSAPFTKDRKWLYGLWNDMIMHW